MDQNVTRKQYNVRKTIVSRSSKGFYSAANKNSEYTTWVLSVRLRFGNVQQTCKKRIMSALLLIKALMKEFFYSSGKNCGTFRFKFWKHFWNRIFSTFFISSLKRTKFQIRNLGQAAWSLMSNKLLRLSLQLSIITSLEHSNFVKTF